MRKFIYAVFILMLCSSSFAAPAKVGVLSPAGRDENDVIKWTENVYDAESRARMFRNSSKIVIFDEMNAMIMALRAGHIDRFTAGAYTAEYIAARNPDFVFALSTRNVIMGLSIALNEKDKSKLYDINKAILSMKNDGTLERLTRENITELGENDPIATELPKIDGAETMKIAITGDAPPMDCILADGRPAGFNTAFLAELSRRTGKNIQLVQVSAGARQAAISSRKVDAVFWTRSIYNLKREILPYPLDKMAGVVISEPYLLEGRATVSIRKEQ
ncbi:MAG: transporter substrate-binding domain-containing protein [Synergistaceae bacterium]|nr:transporter substrate-binding domain-containing protein [Synergistaceae bacterium]